jgi:general secretion pathway protein G
MSRDEGYTLTEMLVVIAVIGMIAAALTPAVFGQMNRARAKSAELQVETVASAVEAFRADVGRYPTASEGLMALIKDPGALEGWSGPYLHKAKALDDPWGHPLVYAPPSAEGGFLVESLGADGKPGGTGLNRDIKASSSP